MAKILVVDDSKFSRNRSVEALRRGGHDVLEAANGQIGLEAVETHAPDCVLLDLMMPVLSGLDFIGRLRGGGSKLPVVVLSADIQTSTRELCENLGVSGFLPKPVPAEDLCRTVESAIANTREGVPCN